MIDIWLLISGIGCFHVNIGYMWMGTIFIRCVIMLKQHLWLKNCLNNLPTLQGLVLFACATPVIDIMYHLFTCFRVETVSSLILIQHSNKQSPVCSAQ